MLFEEVPLVFGCSCSSTHTHTDRALMAMSSRKAPHYFWSPAGSTGALPHERALLASVVFCWSARRPLNQRVLVPGMMIVVVVVVGAPRQQHQQQQRRRRQSSYECQKVRVRVGVSDRGRQSQTDRQRHIRSSHRMRWSAAAAAGSPLVASLSE